MGGLLRRVKAMTSIVGRALKPVVRFGALAFAAASLTLGLPPPSGAAGQTAGAWVYLRDGQPPAAAEGAVEVLAVGDIMPGRGLAGRPDLFAGVSDTLQSASLTLGNLEGAVATAPMAGGSAPGPATPGALLLPLDTPGMLARAGFDLLSLANNHTLDAGPAGLAETRRRLAAAGLGSVDDGAVVERRLGGLTFAFIGWNDLGEPDRSPLLAAVRRARSQADVVLVTVHWGQEFQRHPVLPQRDLAHQLLEAGADAVLGSHPHVVQDLQVAPQAGAAGRAQLVAYSLGNFTFDQGWDDTAQGLALRLWFDANGLRAAKALPLWTAPRPRWMDPASAAALLARVAPPQRIGFTCSADACQPADVPAEARSGLFTSGAIDLTGDGVPELVRLQGAQAEILRGGQVVWRSPPGWQVRDLALGDPSHDGRYEALMAVDGPNGASQPFVIGYRGGLYRQLWGGSPVSDPIFEVELADLDGDGLDELAALEAAPGGAGRTLTVWRWHGWGFSLVWRSPPGAYHDLIVLPAGAGHPARLSVATN
jgi:hypothetical protein